MWKIITIILLVTMLIFGYKFFSKHYASITSSRDVKNSVKLFSNNFTDSLLGYSAHIAPESANFDDESPVVSSKDIGELSPFYGKVQIIKDSLGAEKSAVNNEYIILQANEDNTKPINITGWYLQSMISGVRVQIPDAVTDVQMHQVNPTYEIELSPGQKAIVNSGESPLGISFKTNICSGYFNNFQRFEPEIENNCPMPTTIMSPTIENLQMYGDNCIDLASSLRRCQYLTDKILKSIDVPVTDACIEKLRTDLTYSGCYAQNKNKKDFYADSIFRIFLGEQNALWKDRYEVIRLLDKDGKTVDVFSY